MSTDFSCQHNCIVDLSQQHQGWGDELLYLEATEKTWLHNKLWKADKTLGKTLGKCSSLVFTRAKWEFHLYLVFYAILNQFLSNLRNSLFSALDYLKWQHYVGIYGWLYWTLDTLHCCLNNLLDYQILKSRLPTVNEFDPILIYFAKPVYCYRVIFLCWVDILKQFGFLHYFLSWNIGRFCYLVVVLSLNTSLRSYVERSW